MFDELLQTDQWLGPGGAAEFVNEPDEEHEREGNAGLTVVEDLGEASA